VRYGSSFASAFPPVDPTTAAIMNHIFFGLISLSIVFAVLNGTPAEVGQGALDAAKASVELAIGLVGYIALFLGLMKVVEAAGGLAFMARIIRPVLVRLFPDVPPDHPAMGAMVMNIAANALGLGNAATPFGLKAMKELNELNTEKGTATNAMVLFLAINTSGLALLPTGIIGLRALKGSADAAAIFPTTLLATSISTIVGICAAVGLSRLPVFARTSPAPAHAIEREPLSIRALLPFFAVATGLTGLVVVVYTLGEAASVWIMPLLIFGMLLVGVVRKVKVYEVFVSGAKEGFELAVMIIPYLVAILSAVGMLRSSGGLQRIVGWVSPLTSALGIPGEVLPLALLRPLSGSGAFGITAELITTYGPDSVVGNIASTMNGSTETTFYVLAVYFGSIGVTKIRHAVPAGLAADTAGVLASCWAVHWLLG
jgi:spore maturation protein SpmA